MFMQFVNWRTHNETITTDSRITHRQRMGADHSAVRAGMHLSVSQAAVYVRSALDHSGSRPEGFPRNPRYRREGWDGGYDGGWDGRDRGTGESGDCCQCRDSERSRAQLYDS